MFIKKKKLNGLLRRSVSFILCNPIEKWHKTHTKTNNFQTQIHKYFWTFLSQSIPITMVYLFYVGILQQCDFYCCCSRSLALTLTIFKQQRDGDGNSGNSIDIKASKTVDMLRIKSIHSFTHTICDVLLVSMNAQCFVAFRLQYELLLL